MADIIESTERATWDQHVANKAGNYIVVAGGEYYDANNTFGAKCTTSEAYQYVS